jgi:energy-converting hydrogenase Eha subunit A
MTQFFSFPNPVNDKAARIVATGVVLMSVAFLGTGWAWILIPLTYGFWARVLTGPTMSPLGQLATRVVAPRLGEPRLTPGPPKRFAQAIGVVFSTTALVLALSVGIGAAQIVIVMLLVAASLEAFLGLCLGCKAFAVLMKLGVIPESICAECADLSLRHPQLSKF